MPARPRIVTVEDMTVRQAYGLSPDWRRLPDRAIARRIERPARAYEAAHACCALTSWAARSIVRDYGIPTHKAHVVGVGRNLSLPATERKWASPAFVRRARLAAQERPDGATSVRAAAARDAAGTARRRGRPPADSGSGRGMASFNRRTRRTALGWKHSSPRRPAWSCRRGLSPPASCTRRPPPPGCQASGPRRAGRAT
jgi:hypothetical protein